MNDVRLGSEGEGHGHFGPDLDGARGDGVAQQLYYSVDQVADLLGLHVRTVRSYVRDGRLKATRVGKQYRITREDLAVFTGAPAPASVGRVRHAEVSAVVQIDAISAEEATRLVNTVVATVQGPRSGEPLTTCGWSTSMTRSGPPSKSSSWAAWRPRRSC